MEPNPIDYYPEYRDRLGFQDTIIDGSGRYSLPLDDNDLYTLIQQKRQISKQFAESDLKLEERRRRNRDYWRGKHYAEDAGMPGDYHSDYMDPIIYENSETRFTLASQRMPDIICTPHDDNQKAVEDAQIIEKFLNKKVNNKVSQRMMKDGLRQHEINYTAAIKCLWDPNLARGNGDFKFVLVNPSRLMLDPTAVIPHDGYTADNMEFIGELLEEPVEVVYSKFPKKANDLRALLETASLNNNTAMPAKIRYEEWWLRYYKDGETYEATCWFYLTECLGQQKNPYYDWEGYKTYLPKVDKNGNYKQTTTLDSETKFYNYFDIPRKPYMFFTYQNLGESPYDDTTPMEQSIPTQRLINRVGRQIVEISDNAVPKKVFGNAITKEDARRVSNDPDESIWLDIPDVSKAITWVQAEPPSPALTQLLQDARGRMDALFNTHGPIKGEQGQASESGTAKQITREGDLTQSDDLVDIVVERVVYEMAGWAMQMGKMFYDEPHFLRTTGKDGSVLSAELSRKNFVEGIDVDVKANSVDAMTNRADSMNLATRKAIDPLSMYEDMDKSNPKERTRRLITFLNGAQDGYQTYLKEVQIELESSSNPQPAFTVGGDQTESAEDAQHDIQSMVQDQIIAPPDKFDQKYVQTVLDFVHSGQFQSLPEDIQSNFRDFVQQLSQNFQNFAVNTPGSAFTQGPALPAAPPASPSGMPPAPIAPQPQPGVG
jgi:hypothetical protein